MNIYYEWYISHPIQAAQVFNFMFICIYFIIDDSVLFVYTSRLQFKENITHYVINNMLYNRLVDAYRWMWAGVNYVWILRKFLHGTLRK